MAKKAQTQTGSRAIRAIFEDARDLAEDAAPAQSPDPNLARDGILPGRWPGHPDQTMPPDSPVKMVGRSADGSEYFALSATGHFRTITRWDGRSLTDLFAPDTNFAKWAWPAFGEKKVIEDGEEKKKLVVKRVERDQAFDCLMNAAAIAGDFDPNRQFRGRGGWRDNQDRFVWHAGDWLWQSVKGKLTRTRPAQHDGFLYTRAPTTISPWMTPVSPEESPARRILEHFRSWQWERPYLDPLLLTGWLGVALMGAALKQRPVVFTTGGAGVGKSTLQDLMQNVLSGVVTTTVNTTAAGIYQRAKRDSLPFMIDELESKAGSTRGDAVIELIRIAYTGGDISRGGSDHEATTFTAQQAFFCSAINAPPMNSQDKTRMAVMNLQRLDRKDGIGKMDVSPDTDGRMLLRQIMDGWTDFSGRIKQNYWEALRPQGLDSRAIDTFGGLLAACELLVGPEAMEDVGLPVTEMARLGEIVAAATALERAEILDNWHKCLDQLMQASIEAWRDGVKPTVGGICEALRNRSGMYPASMTAQEARERLQLVGLGVKDRDPENRHGPLLAVPADGPALRRIFADTEFHMGVWYTALKQAPTGLVIRDRGNYQKVKINGSTKHCLLVDLDEFERLTAAG